MSKCAKCPTWVEAVQWIGPVDEMPMPPAPSDLLHQEFFSRRWRLLTPAGSVFLTPGDWIVTDWEGRCYRCDELTYGMADDAAMFMSNEMGNKGMSTSSEEYGEWRELFIRFCVGVVERRPDLCESLNQ